MYTVSQHAIDRFKQRVIATDDKSATKLLKSLAKRSDSIPVLVLSYMGILIRPNREYRQALFKKNGKIVLRIYLVIDTRKNIIVTCFLASVRG